jgi:hypothetical protein
MLIAVHSYCINFKIQIPNDLSAYHFNYIIRKRIKLPETGSLYLFVNGKYLLKGDTLMSDVYETQKDLDGFLYIMYTDETVLPISDTEMCCCFSILGLVVMALLWTVGFTPSWYFGGTLGFTPSVSSADFRAESIVQDYEPPSVVVPTFACSPQTCFHAHDSHGDFEATLSQFGRLLTRNPAGFRGP